MNYKIFYLLVFILAACSGGDQTDISKVKLNELNGQPINLAQFEGKVVFVNFWATWCKPCIQEMPTIASIQEKFKEQNVIFLFASNEDTNQIDKFSKKHNYDFHYVKVENLEALNIQALPTTYIFNSEGKLKFSEPGFRKWDDSENIELITKIINDEK